MSGERAVSGESLARALAAMSRVGESVAAKLAADRPRPCWLCGEHCTRTISPRGTHRRVCISCAQDLPVELLGDEEDA